MADLDSEKWKRSIEDVVRTLPLPDPPDTHHPIYKRLVSRITDMIGDRDALYKHLLKDRKFRIFEINTKDQEHDSDHLSNVVCDGELIDALYDALLIKYKLDVREYLLTLGNPEFRPRIYITLDMLYRLMYNCPYADINQWAVSLDEIL